jgi:hypothetical protein
MIRILGCVAYVCLGLGASVTAGEGGGARMFERLQGLAGEWEGTYEWSGARTGSGTLTANYALTGNGSAVVENLVMGGVPSMTTVYHLDGPDLRMTHYCAAKNQPRLKVSRIDEAGRLARFTFVDATNLGAANPGHVEGFEIEVHETGRLTLAFTFGHGPRTAVETIKLKRVRS